VHTTDLQAPFVQSLPLSEQSVPPGFGPEPSAAQVVSKLPLQTGAPAVHLSAWQYEELVVQYSDDAQVSVGVYVVPAALH